MCKKKIDVPTFSISSGDSFVLKSEASCSDCRGLRSLRMWDSDVGIRMYVCFYKWKEYSFSKLEPLCVCVLAKFMITPKRRLEGICVTGIGLLYYIIFNKAT